MDLPVATKRMMKYDDGREEPLLAAVEINAACNTTIVLARMIRNGKRGTIDPGSKGP